MARRASRAGLSGEAGADAVRAHPARILTRVDAPDCFCCRTPNSRRMPSVDTLSRRARGRPTLARMSIGRAMRLAMTSGCVMASRFGTSCPESTRSTLAEPPQHERDRFAIRRQERHLLHCGSNRPSDRRLANRGVENANAGDAGLDVRQESGRLRCQDHGAPGPGVAGVGQLHQARTTRADDGNLRHKQGGISPVTTGFEKRVPPTRSMARSRKGSGKHVARWAKQ